MRASLSILVPLMISAVPLLAAEQINVPQFRGISLNGGGSVVIVPGPAQRVTILEGSSAVTRMHIGRGEQLRIDSCRGRCPRNYRLRVQIQSPRLPDVAISGGGSIKAMPGFRGQSKISAAIHGGGRIDVRAVEAASVSAAVSGGGELLVRARSSLSAAIQGGGLIRYWGNPQVSSAVTGGGAVKRGE